MLRDGPARKASPPACWYLNKLLRRDAPFAAEPDQRDPAIAALREELRE
jgi:hypothetical protein